jgi:hypothetical protein
MRGEKSKVKNKESREKTSRILVRRIALVREYKASSFLLRIEDQGREIQVDVEMRGESDVASSDCYSFVLIVLD